MRLTIGIFILSLGSSIAKNATKVDDEVECGVPAVKSRVKQPDKILDGEEVTPHSYPWAVNIYKSEEKFCGGSLITNQHVLTAGHCLHVVCNEGCEVVLGAHNVLDNAEAGQIRVPITMDDSVIHPDFHEVTFYEVPDHAISIEHDLAIITLKDPIEFSDTIRPICLPEPDMPAVGTSVTMLGWDTTETEPHHLQGLMRADSDVVSMEDVIQGTLDSIDKLTEDQFSEYKHLVITSLKDKGKPCRISENTTIDEFKTLVTDAIKITPMDQKAPVYNGKNTGCRNDAGGGLNLKGTDDKFYVAGTSSSSLLLCMKYQIVEPWYYTTVAFHMDWINGIINSKK